MDLVDLHMLTNILSTTPTPTKCVSFVLSEHSVFHLGLRVGSVKATLADGFPSW